MTTRTTKTAKTVTVLLMCPSCRCLRKCRPVGVAVIARRRREVMQCGQESCSLVWVPARSHLATLPAAA